MSADTEVETFLSGDLDEVPERFPVNRCSFRVVLFAKFAAVIVAMFPTRRRLCFFLPPTLSGSQGLHSLVGGDTGSLKSLGAQLLVLVGDEVDAERELVDICALTAKVEDADLWVWHTTVEAGLRVWLVFAVA